MKPVCQMTMGEHGNYYKCGKPAKGYIISRPMNNRMNVCGIHGRGKIVRPLVTEKKEN